MRVGPKNDDLCMHSLDSVPPRAVTDSINQLITMCTQQAPGQKECDNALRELEVGTWQAKCYEVKEGTLGLGVKKVS